MSPEQKPEQLSFLDAPAPAVAESGPKTAAGKEDDFASVRPQDLPESLQPLSELLGLPKVFHLVRTYGGTRLHVPVDPAGDHHLCKVLGRGQARLLSYHYAGEDLYIPSLSRVRRLLRDRRIRRAFDGGMKVKDLVRVEGLSQRRITTILNETEEA